MHFITALEKNMACGHVANVGPAGWHGQTLFVRAKKHNQETRTNKVDKLVKSLHCVILRSKATKNLNDIRFFAITQNDNRGFSRLFTRLSKFVHATHNKKTGGQCHPANLNFHIESKKYWTGMQVSYFFFQLHLILWGGPYRRDLGRRYDNGYYKKKDPEKDPFFK